MRALLGIAGCSHKLVGRAGETTVNVFPTKKDFDNVMSMKSRGGAEGMVGGLGETFMAQKVARTRRSKFFRQIPRVKTFKSCEVLTRASWLCSKR